jgi:hypothetical protein
VDVPFCLYGLFIIFISFSQHPDLYKQLYHKNKHRRSATEEQLNTLLRAGVPDRLVNLMAHVARLYRDSSGAWLESPQHASFESVALGLQ